MSAPKNNESCHHVQNAPQRCKIKLLKFHFHILWCYGVINESFSGGEGEFSPVRSLQWFPRIVRFHDLVKKAVTTTVDPMIMNRRSARFTQGNSYALRLITMDYSTLKTVTLP